MNYRIETHPNQFGGGYVKVIVDGKIVHDEYYMWLTSVRLHAWWWDYKLTNGLYTQKKAKAEKKAKKPKFPRYEGEVK